MIQEIVNNSDAVEHSFYIVVNEDGLYFAGFNPELNKAEFVSNPFAAKMFMGKPEIKLRPSEQIVEISHQPMLLYLNRLDQEEDRLKKYNFIIIMEMKFFISIIFYVKIRRFYIMNFQSIVGLTERDCEYKLKLFARNHKKKHIIMSHPIYDKHRDRWIVNIIGMDHFYKSLNKEVLNEII